MASCSGRIDTLIQETEQAIRNNTDRLAELEEQRQQILKHNERLMVRLATLKEIADLSEEEKVE